MQVFEHCRKEAQKIKDQKQFHGKIIMMVSIDIIKLITQIVR